VIWRRPIVLPETSFELEGTEGIKSLPKGNEGLEDEHIVIIVMVVLRSSRLLRRSTAYC
jgi:hypothetical protein